MLCDQQIQTSKARENSTRNFGSQPGKSGGGGGRHVAIVEPKVLWDI